MRGRTSGAFPSRILISQHFTRIQVLGFVASSAICRRSAAIGIRRPVLKSGATPLSWICWIPRIERFSGQRLSPDFERNFELGCTRFLDTLAFTARHAVWSSVKRNIAMADARCAGKVAVQGTTATLFQFFFVRRVWSLLFGTWPVKEGNCTGDDGRSLDGGDRVRQSEASYGGLGCVNVDNGRSWRLVFL